LPLADGHATLTFMKLPNHLAVIPDGNRRWAKDNRWSLFKGYQKGVARFRDISLTAIKEGVPFFTFWAGSESNLSKRSRGEIALLVLLAKNFLKQELADKTLIKNEVSFKTIGRWRQLLKDNELERLFTELEAKTAQFTKRHLTVLFGYDGQEEMREAVKKGGENFTNNLWTKDLPPVDLVIRTGGEPHWSAGFMMWHTANSQFYFTPKLWPDFSPAELDKAFDDYAGRNRRFGR